MPWTWQQKSNNPARKPIRRRQLLIRIKTGAETANLMPFKRRRRKVTSFPNASDNIDKFDRQMFLLSIPIHTPRRRPTLRTKPRPGDREMHLKIILEGKHESLDTAKEPLSDLEWLELEGPPADKRDRQPLATVALWCSGSMLASHARGPGFNPRAG